MTLKGDAVNQRILYLRRAAILGAIWSFVSIPTLYGINALLSGSFYPVGLLPWFYMIGVVAALHFLLIGVPLLTSFLWRGWVSRMTFVFGGILVAAMSGIHLVWLSDVFRGSAKLRDFLPAMIDNSLLLISLATYGLVSGFVFFSIMERANSQIYLAAAIVPGLGLSFAMVSPLSVVYLWGVYGETYWNSVLLEVSAAQGMASMMVFLIFGVPLLALFLWRGWLSCKTFAFGGSAAAVAAGIFWTFTAGILQGEASPERYSLGNFLWVVDVLFFGFCGFLMGLMLWKVKMKRICAALVSSVLSDS